MTDAIRVPRFQVICVFAVLFSSLTFWVPSAYSQTDTATLEGNVLDPSGAVIPDAAVTVINNATQQQRSGRTDKDGGFSIPSLPPATYTVRVIKEGFEAVNVEDVVLHTADRQNVQIKLRIGKASQTVTVSGETMNDSSTVSMTVDREFVEDMPLNGRSFQDLIQLAPGAVSANGYYSVNGQRTDGNNYTVDGVSANLGGIYNESGSGIGPGISGSAPLQTILDTTQSLASIDSLQEFTIQTSGYTAEYGRSPGAQVQFTTRSGTNEIHGTLFEYLRNTAFDANSFSNDYYGDPKTAEHQNDFGGTVGGPLIIPKIYSGKDKTFYFFSYEGLRLLLPSNESEYVPTQVLRSWASPYVQPALNAVPLPNLSSPGNQDGCTIADSTTGQPTACDALFYYGYSYPSSLDNISARVDHNLGKRLHAFVRYADTPSSETTGAEQLNAKSINTSTWTAGLTANVTNTLFDDLRFNYSQDQEGDLESQNAVGGSIPLLSDVVIPPAYSASGAYGLFRVRLSGTSLNIAPYVSTSGTITAQHQLQLVDSLAWTRGKHGLKFGGDWRRLTPVVGSYPYESSIYVTTLTGIQQGTTSEVEIEAVSPGKPVFDNLSFFAEDHWKISPRLSVDYGLRWEFNPPPGPSDGIYPAVLTSDDLATAQLAPLGTAPYKTNYHSFAPRFGFAWNAVSSAKYALTVRGGFGIFYDTGQTAVGASYYGGYPFAASVFTTTPVSLPLPAAVSAPPSLNVPATPPYTFGPNVSSVNLTLPYTEQWSLSVDEALNANNRLTISYLGNNGRKLLFNQNYPNAPEGNANFPEGLLFTSNASQSSYNALQVQDTGRIANGLDVVGSFTLAHALDNASNDNSLLAPQWGNSNYDLRRILNIAVNYQTRAVGSNRWTEAVTHGWLLANRFSTQSGSPITNIYQSEVDTPNGGESYYYPDLVPSVPIYLHGRAADYNGTPVLGNWRLNRAAFACTTTTNSAGSCVGTPTRQGTLGRNYIRNPSFWALNTGLQRSFPIHEQLHFNFRVDAFNVFNHPNPVSSGGTSLAYSTFGQLLGNTATIGSNNALYSMGAARSLQFSLRLQF